jgi:hypothetical protein
MQENDGPVDETSKLADDTLTLVALGIVAFVVADMTHEALGHGLAVLAVGAKPVMLTTCFFRSTGSASRWIPAAGGIANLVVGLVSVLALRLLRTAQPSVRCFMVLLAAFNLLFAAAYPAYSGIALFGDWAAVISGLTPTWLWRGLLVVVSIISYYFALLLLAVELRPFCGSDAPEALDRLQRITLIPFIAALGVAGLGGAFNPVGWTVIFTSALPGAAAAFGLTQIDNFPAVRVSGSSVPAGIITRSLGWILAAAAVLIFFVAVIGPGIKFRSNL